MVLRNPPIVELMIGVQFATQRSVDSTRLILFWNEFLKSEYPDVVEAPPLPDLFEKFGDDVLWQLPGLQMSLEPARHLRYQYSNPSRDRMVQLQSSRFLLNWIRREADYPRFSKLHTEFANLFGEWINYASANNIGETVPNQWELCYVNFIPQGTLWQTPADWHRISPLFVAGAADYEPLSLEDRRFQWQLLMTGQTGRITLTAMQVKNDKGEKGLQLSVYARGPAASVEEVHSRLQIAHDCIIQFFAKCASEEAKNHWGI